MDETVVAEVGAESAFVGVAVVGDGEIVPSADGCTSSIITTLNTGGFSLLTSVCLPFCDYGLCTGYLVFLVCFTFGRWCRRRWSCRGHDGPIVMVMQ